MQIEYGVNPNCSETVYRIPNNIAEMIPKELLDGASIDGTIGYSQMLPTKDTICFYFYQSHGEILMEWLENNKIVYDIQDFMGVNKKNFVKIKLTAEEKLQPSYGGNGTFLRRLPFKNVSKY